MSIWPTTTNEAMPLVAEAIETFGCFRPSAVDWLTPFVLVSDGPGDWDVYNAIVRGGEPVSFQDKAAAGLPAWFEFGHSGWDLMTEAGRKDPKKAVDQILEHVFWLRRIAHRRLNVADLVRSTTAGGRPLYAGVLIRSDHLCCATARGLDGRLFPVDAYPDLPLAGCDQLWCKCDWTLQRRARRAR